MYRLIVTIAAVCMLLSSAGLASEIDSVTPRKVELENSRSVINQIFNQRIEQGVEKANERLGSLQAVEELQIFAPKYCDEERLYAEVRKAIFDSATATWGLKGYDLDKQLRELLAKQSYSLSLNDSIYRDIDYLEGFSLNLKELSDVVNLDGHLIGLDKLGHFFAEGWRYFEMVEIDGKTLYDALAWGRGKESGMFGYTTTGIFSFADMVANFNGMRFWNKLLLKRDDPLKGYIGNLLDSAYVSCDYQIVESIRAGRIVKAWKYDKRFDIADFVDGSWDEGNNCNSYADPVIEEKVTERIHAVDPGFTCPIHPQACAAARVKYAEFARFLLHPACLTAE